MRRPASKELSRIREKQRSHAKLRFEQRFEIELNRDRLHEIEKKIASGQAVHVESKNNRRNYLVEVDGELIVVGYAPSTHRVVTALPNDYLEKLPPQVVTQARFQLLPSAREAVKASIAAGDAALIYETDSARFYSVEFEGLLFRIGYDVAADRLIPYRNRRGRRTRESATPAPAPVGARLAILDLPEELGAAFHKQISQKYRDILITIDHKFRCDEIGCDQKLFYFKGLWSHPPGLNRRPADYELALRDVCY
jgi:hypothetical protein